LQTIHPNPTFPKPSIMIFTHMTDADIVSQFNLLPQYIHKMHMQLMYWWEIQILLETTAQAWQYNRRRRGRTTMASTHNLSLHASNDTVTSSDCTTSHYNRVGVLLIHEAPDRQEDHRRRCPQQLASIGLQTGAMTSRTLSAIKVQSPPDRPRERARPDDAQPAPGNIQASSSTST